MKEFLRDNSTIALILALALIIILALSIVLIRRAKHKDKSLKMEDWLFAFGTSAITILILTGIHFSSSS